MARSNLSVGALLAILLCVSIAAIDHSIIATALPIMGKEMNITQSGLQWVANSFTIAFASGLFVAGRLADRYGRKRILLIGLVVFLAAAAYTATATTALGVTIGRGLMGLGGTMLLPSTLAIISSQAAPSRKALAISLWSGVFGVGVALGPLLGGWLLDNYSWNSIFWINVPLLVLAIV
ncbi:MAG TPA: MFS transporter, partial [Candidatus Saccharimonadales bacterium]|nr:MFS transporter [Candidatus Saccharimonadales bacterium]